MTDDGEDYDYVYDPFGRLRKVESRANATLVAEFRYNGLNQRITTHFDTDADKDVDASDVISHFAYDGRWRMAARYEDTNTDPAEQWVFHHAGLAESGGSPYIDSVILRDRDTTANGTLDERVYYLQNWRADVVALIKDNGDQIEQVRYEPYGSPFGLPAGDTDGDGDVDQADVDQVTAWYNASTYDSRGDLNMDGSVNLTDITLATLAKVNGDTLGLYGLSLVDNRKGYAGYEALSELTDAKWDVRNRVLISKLGYFNARARMTGSYRTDDDDDPVVAQCQQWVEECFAEGYLSHLNTPNAPCQGYGLGRPPGGVKCSTCKAPHEGGAEAWFYCKNEPPRVPGNAKPRIVLCAGNIPNKRAACSALAHEMVHWCDQQRTGGCPYKRPPGDGIYPDDRWIPSCKRRACSEVRAAAFSGQCCKDGSRRNPNETFLGCVRRLAKDSTASSNCPENDVNEIIRTGGKCKDDAGNIDLKAAEKLCDRIKIPVDNSNPGRRPG